MGKSFQSHAPKPPRLGRTGLGAGKPAVAAGGVKTAAEGRGQAPAVLSAPKVPSTASPAKEIGGPSGPEPTRYGDWERKGICYDF